MFNNTVMKTILSALLILFMLALGSCSGKKAAKPEGPFDPKASFVFANEQIEKKKYEDARATLIEIKNRDTSRQIAPLAQLKIADSYIKEEEPERGIAEYRRFLDEYPDNQYAPYAQYQIAMVHFNKIEDAERGYGYAEKALKVINLGLKYHPRSSYLHEKLGAAYEMLEDSAKALESYETALRLNPNNETAAEKIRQLKK